MEEIAFAKLNLALHVRGREPDGYHRIETVFAFAEAGDRLSVNEGDSLTLTVTGAFSGRVPIGEGNLVLRAAEALRTASGVRQGASILLDKCLPVAAGIGGGSADAGAALRLLARHWRLEMSPADLMRLAAGLGADVPACLLSRSARGDGRGDKLSPIDAAPLAGAPILLANPGIALATSAVFGAWDGQDRGPLGDPIEGRNDLEMPARLLVPEIGHVLDALHAPGARLVRMSGSGATCFALFEDEASRDAARRDLSARYPIWWLLASRVRG